MNNKMKWFLITALIISSGTIGAYWIFRSELPKHEESRLIAPPHPLPSSIPIAVTSSEPLSLPDSSKGAKLKNNLEPFTLPYLANSDKFVFDVINSLIKNHSLVKLFYKERIIHDIVVSTINLTQQSVPVKVMPFVPPTGNFITYNLNNRLVISPDNKQRYANYIKIAEAVDTNKLVALYIQLYPLLQQQYKELGYPNKSFNDLLIETIDDLLDAPDLKDPVHIVQLVYLYQFEDADLEALSIGQKILIRLGVKNENLIKSKLSEIKKELVRRANEIEK